MALRSGAIVHRMKRLLHARNVVEARLIVGLLAKHGIRAFLQGESLEAASGVIPPLVATSPSVWLEYEGDEPRALKLVAAARQAVNPEACNRCGYDLRGTREPRCPECGWQFRIVPTWQCSACGEAIEAQFDACWKCGAARGA
jgi:hypothetical protein